MSTFSVVVGGMELRIVTFVRVPALTQPTLAPDNLVVLATCLQHEKIALRQSCYWGELGWPPPGTGLMHCEIPGSSPVVHSSISHRFLQSWESRGLETVHDFIGFHGLQSFTEGHSGNQQNFKWPNPLPHTHSTGTHVHCYSQDALPCGCTIPTGTDIHMYNIYSHTDQLYNIHIYIHNGIYITYRHR